ncbi:hypothetical protein QTG54_016446 [Skeletonema marinoi]|uniref:Uncharacterized protein n=1 Tax=Skeletonema marinoi TaxID=267567 RepID=A0AAD8XSN4_9STRA|nr:hypothetical protein QTG54_016446 [Skeletonema marinoi]
MKTPATKPSAAKKKRAKKQTNDDDPFPLEIQASNLKVSAFCRRGAGYHKPKPPGGFIYEKAKSRHLRHREVYKSSRGGKEVAEHAVPLGHGERKVSRFLNERSAEASLRRKAVMDEAKKKMLQRK